MLAVEVTTMDPDQRPFWDDLAHDLDLPPSLKSYVERKAADARTTPWGYIKRRLWADYDRDEGGAPAEVDTQQSA